MSENVIFESILREQREARKESNNRNDELHELRLVVQSLAEQMEMNVKQTAKTNDQIESLVKTFTIAESHRSNQDAKIGIIERSQIRSNAEIQDVSKRVQDLELESKVIGTKQKGLYAVIGAILTTAVSIVLMVASKMLSNTP